MDTLQIEKILVSEIKLTPILAKIFLLITTEGKMTHNQIAKRLNISEDEALESGKNLMKLGAFIDISPTEFEAMHPRFTAVNMYRKMCEREKIDFKRNKNVDSIGVLLERSYDAARTK